MERVGADAVPVVVLINFLVGFVMAFQGAVQLKQFGANIFVADLVGLSITRELGTADDRHHSVRSLGAAFAAELGSMKVSEEVDALRTLGLGPIRYLVLPRTLGALPRHSAPRSVGRRGRDPRRAGGRPDEPRPHRRRLPQRDEASSYRLGCVFRYCQEWCLRMAIALIACQQGLATTGGAKGSAAERRPRS